jgi:hypothetical protein
MGGIRRGRFSGEWSKCVRSVRLDLYDPVIPAAGLRNKFTLSSDLQVEDQNKSKAIYAALCNLRQLFELLAFLSIKRK